MSQQVRELYYIYFAVEDLCKGYKWLIFFISPIISALSSSHTDLCPWRLASVVCITQALLPFGFLLGWTKARHEQGRRRVRSEHLLHHLLSCKEVGWQQLLFSSEGHSPCLQPVLHLQLQLSSSSDTPPPPWLPFFLSLWCFTIPVGFSSL